MKKYLSLIIVLQTLIYRAIPTTKTLPKPHSLPYKHNSRFIKKLSRTNNQSNQTSHYKKSKPQLINAKTNQHNKKQKQKVVARQQNRRRFKKLLNISPFQSHIMPGLAYWHLLVQNQDPTKSAGIYSISQPYRKKCLIEPNKCMEQENFRIDIKINENIDVEQVKYLDQYYDQMYSMLRKNFGLYSKSYNPTFKYGNIDMEMFGINEKVEYCSYKRQMTKVGDNGRLECHCSQT